MGSTFKTVEAIGLSLPGVQLGTSYGTPALKVGGKLLARLREDGTTLVVPVDPVNRDFLLRLEADIFFLTDHYRDYPWVLVRLPRIGRRRLREALEEGWRLVAPKRLRAAHDLA
jgi:hypothetical protein